MASTDVDATSGLGLSEQNLLLVISGALVFFVQIGFATSVSGGIRAQHAAVSILKHLLAVCCGALGFYIMGYAIAFGDGGRFMGYKHFGLNKLATSGYGHWFYEFMCAIIPPIIASNAVAEHVKVQTHMLGTFFMCAWVYPVVAHWVWSEEGWLSMRLDRDALYHESGALDFAGSGVLHMVGGFAGIAGVWLVGPRSGRFTDDGAVQEIPGNNAGMILIGLFMSWFGWYGLNTGRALGLLASDNLGGFNHDSPFPLANQKVAGQCAITTTLSAASGGLTALFLAKYCFSSETYAVWDVVSTANGVLAGLVSISACCAVVDPWAAVVVGVIGGIIYFLAAQNVPKILKVDDALEVVSVHAFCGVWGLLASAAFADEDLVRLTYGDHGKDGTARRPFGFIEGGDGRLLLSTINCILAIGLWVLAHTIIFHFLVKLLRMDRLSIRGEIEGCRSRLSIKNARENQNMMEEVEEIQSIVRSIKQRNRNFWT